MSIFDDFDATYGNGTYSGMPDGMGGTNIFHDGQIVDHMDADGILDSKEFGMSTPNAEGGHDVLDYETGRIVSHSEPNVMGGMNIYDADMHLNRVTMPNADGGEDIYDSDMQLEGHTMPNVMGSEDLYAVGSHESTTCFDDAIDMGNGDEILSHDDPLKYSADFRPGQFDFSTRK